MFRRHWSARASAPTKQQHCANLRHNLIESRGRRFQPPISTAPPAVQSNVVYLPQEALNDFSRLGLAADKR
jgi:hypothetical protein